MNDRRQLERDIVDAARRWTEAWKDAGYGQVRPSYAVEARLAALVDRLDETVEPTPIAALPETGAVAEGAQDTSRAAALRVYKRKTMLYGILEQLALCRVFGQVDFGATDEELEGALRKSHQTLSSARRTLVLANWIEDTGKRRLTSTGSEAIVWNFTEAGWDKWKEMDRQ